jgi:hypothetical protein
MNFDAAQLVTNYGNFRADVVSFQGELMELTLIDDEFNTEIGSSITCIYHNNYMESRLIRKNGDQLFLFIPQPVYSLFEDRRNSVRIDVNMPAILINKEFHIPVKLTDISLKGFSFIASDSSTIQLKDDYHLAISSDYLSIVPHVRIINQILSTDGIRFGTEVLYIQQDSLLQLKKFLMYHQVLFKPREEL